MPRNVLVSGCDCLPELDFEILTEDLDIETLTNSQQVNGCQSDYLNQLKLDLKSANTMTLILLFHMTNAD